MGKYMHIHALPAAGEMKGRMSAGEGGREERGAWEEDGEARRGNRK